MTMPLKAEGPRVCVYRRGSPWTPERNRKVQKLLDAGASLNAIAKAIGISRNSVMSRLNRVGLKTKNVRGSVTDWSWWTPERDVQLKNLTAMGRGTRAILQEMKITHWK